MNLSAARVFARSLGVIARPARFGRLFQTRHPLALAQPFRTMSSDAAEAAPPATESCPPPAKKAKKSKVYTRTGDKGTSVLYNMTRLEKDNDFFKALGDADELNASLGLAREYCGSLDVGPQLIEIQSRLLDIGSAIATPMDGSSSAAQLSRAHFDGGHVLALEKWIDHMDSELPPLTNFILPSGGLAASHLHVARTICRRAERRVAPLAREALVQKTVAVYLNRLSDYLFVSARYAAMKEGAEEIKYKKDRLKNKNKRRP